MLGKIEQLLDQFPYFASDRRQHEVAALIQMLLDGAETRSKILSTHKTRCSLLKRRNRKEEYTVHVFIRGIRL